ncbi:PREDICTED: zinc finger BED domain-containing protein 1-like [Amphimedon queenslandica]|uniref:BED-type domain-containing protein n=1 Tax=Amphimedon queenslandica TaxID=400682 RepID=A0A1X7TNT0_AMPQE|nr:PREDICTED: zinc finger BED domain-containing protein 1-like [Amphimedon queenslandica]|eukprot:XP_019858606.1 PREDICTED: zinc finger BED domain-containing protein 1-like [Amphimedon queenslandica]
MAASCEGESEERDGAEDIQDIASTGLVSKRNTTSFVWQYFGFRPDDSGRPREEDRPICKICSKIVISKGGNTSNLLSHIRIKHPEEYQRLKEEKKVKEKKKETGQNMTIVEALGKSSLYSRSSKKWQLITDTVTFCLAKDSLPLNLVEKPGFQKMIRNLDPKYDLPSRKYFSNIAIPKMYGQLKDTVTKDLENIHHFSCTSDLWSSATMEPYISLTVHFVTDQFEFKSRCLQTLFCPDDHTGENVALALTESFKEWNLSPDRLSCCITDNGSNFVKATTILNWPRLSCFSHNLHLAITNTTKDDTRVSRILALSRKIVGSFSHSWKKKRDLRKAQVDHNLPEHSLINDCDTRWGSQQRMIGRILEQEKAVRQVLGSDRKTTHLIPNWQDLDVMESLDKVLSPLAEFTNILSSEKLVTISSLKPLLHHLKTEVLIWKENDTDLTVTLKQKILSSLLSRYSSSEINDLLDKATFIDPRFRLEYVADDHVATIKESILQEAVELTSSETSDVAPLLESPEQPEPSTKKRKLGQILKKKGVTSGDGPLSTRDKAEREIEQYLVCPKIDTEDDPLVWWLQYSSSYPLLSKVAKKYFSICATSEASERLFSVSGHIVNSKRTCLKPEKVNMLTFLAKNLDC